VKNNKTIRKIFILAAWVVVIGGLLSLLVAANSRGKVHLCRKVQVGIKGTGENYYIEQADILRALEKSAGAPLVKRPVARINLAQLEKGLEKSAWIRDAELYFDNSDVLHVNVLEREPIARVFTTGGQSFYLDSSCVRLPLLDRVTARVPVVTGFTAAKKLNARDSILLKETRTVAHFIHTHPFWNAQIGQIDIQKDGSFELVPVIGNHIIRLGGAADMETKLANLLVFYKQVLSKTGFDKYAVLDIRFNDQVVGVHKGSVPAVDSATLKKNIEELLRLKLESESVSEALPAVAPVKDTAKALEKPRPAPVKTIPAPVKKIVSKPAKTKPSSKPVVKPKTEVKKKPQPKAVMKKKP
jgi:cell division protein FtsQ